MKATFTAYDAEGKQTARVAVNGRNYSVQGDVKLLRAALEQFQNFFYKPEPKPKSRHLRLSAVSKA